MQQEKVEVQIICPNCHHAWGTEIAPPGPLKCPECQWRRRNREWVWADATLQE